jgi:iron complex outermembrane receptor protein
MVFRDRVERAARVGRRAAHGPAALAALLAGLAWTAPALAGDGDSSSHAGAVGGDAAPGGIVVTARRRAEDAQDVPVSMSVVGADALAATYTVNTGLLTQLVPALGYSSPNPRNTSVTIRGLGSGVAGISQANDGLEPGVGFYVDQVYHARPATAAFDFTDVEQIEVLRGPQGTLFGKNTAAGAISIASRKPQFAFGGEAEVSAGTRDLVQARAAVTGPLAGDVLAFRLSGLLNRRGGIVRNVRYDRQQNDLDNRALRGQLLLSPGDGFSLRLIADWSSFKGECCVPLAWKVVDTLKAAGREYPALAAGQAYRLPGADVFDRLTDIDAPLGVDTSEGGLGGIAEWDLGVATVTSVSAWRFWKWNVDNDRDYIGLPIQTIQRIPSRHDQYSQELRIASNGKGAVEYVAGLHYLDQKITGTQNTVYGPLATYWLLPAGRPADLLDGYGLQAATRFTASSYGVFGEVTWRPLPRFAVTGGIRYTYEEKDGAYAATTFGGLGTTVPSQIADKNSILRAQTYAARVADGSASGRVNLAWEPGETVMVYLGHARAEKSGGINMAGLPVDTAGQPVLATAVIRPERHEVWEAGIKLSAFGGALTVDADVFRTEVKDFQTNVVDTVAPAALRAYLANIPEVRVKGVEIDAALRLGTRLSLRLAGAYTDSKYLSYANGPCPIERIGTGTAACDLTGKALPATPKWSGSASGEYVLPMPPGSLAGDLVLRADVSARSRVFGDGADSVHLVIPGQALVNASLGYRTPGWDVMLFARNLFDWDYLQNVTAQAGNSGLILANPGEPRIVGVTLRVRQ